MVTVLMPMVCPVTPCWLRRGRLSSVAWLPFLNCACALVRKTTKPNEKPSRKREMLRTNTPSLFREKGFRESEIRIGHAQSDRRKEKERVSRKEGKKRAGKNRC